VKSVIVITCVYWR